jgi:hypothetical protein
MPTGADASDVHVAQLVQPHPAEGWHQVLVRVYYSRCFDQSLRKN